MASLDDAAAAAALRSAQRHLDQLSSSDDERVGLALPQLLPQLLRLLNLNHTGVRAKAVEALAHLSKRVRPNRSLQVPCESLACVAADPSASPFARNFAAAFLDLGCGRLPTPGDRGALARLALGALALQTGSSTLPSPFSSSSFSPTPSEVALCAVAMRVVEDLAAPPPLHMAESSAATATTTPTLAAWEDPAAVQGIVLDLRRPVDVLLDALLCPPLRPPHLKQLTSQLAEPQQQPSTLAAAATTPAAGGSRGSSGGSSGCDGVVALFPAPPGLSTQRLKRLIGRAPAGGEETFEEAWTTTVRTARKQSHWRT